DGLDVLQRLIDVLNRAWSSWNGRHTGFLGQALGGRLVSHLADLIAGRADERDVGGLAGVGELGVLGEKAVAGVDRVGSGDFRRGDQVGDAKIGLPAGWGADADIIVREADV